MAKVTVKKIEVENFKCFKTLSADTDKPVVTISGANGTGKTSLAEALMITLCNKCFDGTTPDNIRPHDKEGNVIHEVPVESSITIAVDGVDHVIERRYEEKWVRPRGQTDLHFEGNVISWSLDGIPYREKDLTAWLDENICKRDVLLSCSNANVFLNTLRKSTVEARSYLERISGFSLENFLNENPQFAEISATLNGHDLESVLKSLSKQRLAQNKELETKKSNYDYELNKSITFREVADIADLENQVNETKASLDFIIEQNKKHYKILFQLDVLRKQLSAEKAKSEEQAKNEMGSVYRMVLKLNEDIHETDKEIERKTYEFNNIKSNLATLELQKKDAEQHLKEAEERKPSENQYICEYCGQMMPVDKVAEANEKFETEKKKAIEGYKGVINYFSDMTDGNNKKLEGIKESIDSLNEKLKNLNTEYSQAVNTYNQMKSMPYPIPEEVAKLEAEIKALEEKEKTVAGYDKEIAACTQHIMELTTKINEAKSNELFNQSMAEQHKYELEGLASLVREKAQALASIEQEIEMLKDFSVKKNAKLAELINPHFSRFYFKFLDYTVLENNPYEVCRMIDKETGTDYMNGLNTSNQLLINIDLLNGLQDLQNVNVPLILDQVESINEKRIPKLDRQLICLKVTDGSLTVD